MPILEIVNDDNPQNPRDNDCLGIFAGRKHRRYSLGDKIHAIKWDDVASLENMGEYMKTLGVSIWLPVYMYEHGGVVLGTEFAYPFTDRFDAGQAGVIYATDEKILKEFGGETITPETKEKVLSVFRAEIAMYSAYMNGDVYGFRIMSNEICPTCEHTKQNELEACYGFYSKESAEKAGNEALKTYV